MSDRFYRLNLLTIALAFVVITVGAYVRLADAGLGCPDWPGCYGHLDVPALGAETEAANAAFPERPVEAPKAWKEMIHRYLASTLGLLILAMAWMAWRRRKRAHQQRVLPWMLVGLVIFQGILGMWTVTWLLKPLVVTAHLLGGMTTLALLWWCLLRQGRHFSGWAAWSRLRLLAGVALVALFAQLFLGAWTSTNYAALACPDFPTCQGQWWPDTDYAQAFTLWHGLGINYEYGVLDAEPRATIHWVHRLGAIVVAVVMLVLASVLWRAGGRDDRWRWLASALLLAVTLQIVLGITAVVAHLPLLVAVAHNGGAALLLLVLMAVNHASWQMGARLS
ncbi:COX15/CtaA family protein [Spectribacter hydrogenoxidans]|uniref:COX15/CtaA family protein n=1 Tax=Spectribacter hydrogenoxidans TaxID=3075608 RepID=A0ABU3BY59_9GAMM|nr:COX15/CtaA family protein [Salinisphaera sp. W335]MDT0634237.1 COX15/CtaA family protein [Salinisphaera sp. W335]